MYNCSSISPTLYLANMPCTYSGENAHTHTQDVHMLKNTLNPLWRNGLAVTQKQQL